VRVLLALVALLALVGACQRVDKSAAPADCSRVGEALATFEIGNYATPEQRAPLVAKHKAGCESARVTTDEATCLGNAKDTWAAKACLPRMFPADAPTAGRSPECATVASRMRAAVMKEVGDGGSAAAAQMAKLMPIIQAACNEDHWPQAILKCFVDGTPGDMNVFTACSNQLPKPLQDKLAQRFQAALQGEQPPQPQQ
jgi:hypothetical protein